MTRNSIFTDSTLHPNLNKQKDNKVDYQTESKDWQIMVDLWPIMPDFNAHSTMLLCQIINKLDSPDHMHLFI